jgi:mannose-1-phosphate guanylyltransferase
VKAVVLVGGEGTRLRPLTYATPKQMLPIVGTPMLERVVAHLATHGVSEVILSLGYLPDRFVEAYPSFLIAGVPVAYAVEPEPLDTAGAIRFAAQHGGVTSTFIVVNGDVLTDLDVTALIAFHRDRGAAATIALHPVPDPSRFGVVPTDEAGRVLAFVEKPPRDEAPTNEINAGTYVLEPGVLELIAPDERVSVERVTFPALAQAGMLYALADSGYWLDTGTPEAYLRAHADIISGVRPVALDPPARGGSWVHREAVVDPSARLVGATVDRGCRVAAGASVVDSVLLPGAEVGADASVRGCILGPGSVVGAAAVLGPICVIGAHERVEPGSRLEGDIRIGGPR